MSEIDDLIQPDNLDNNGNIAGASSKPKVKKNEILQSKLQSLKDLLKEDDVIFNTADHLPLPGDFPVSQNIKLINYADEDAICIEEATGVIDSIILNYIKSENLLKSEKVVKIKNYHIKTLAELDGLVKTAKANKVMLQEGIDAGDMAPEMFKMVKEFSMDMRANIDARSKHIESCETYWRNYASMYGLENKEEEIIRKTEAKEDEGPKKTITDITSLNDIIEKKMREQNDIIDNAKLKKESENNLAIEKETSNDDSLLLNDSIKRKKKN